VSRGAAVAAFNAFATGGRIILNRPGRDQGVPADSDVRAIIRPFSGTIFDGRHYCAEDWHVLMLAWIDGGDPTYTRRDAEAALGPIANQLVLDNRTLSTQRTPIKRFLAPEAPPVGMDEAYFFNEGTILSPDELAPGSHRFSYVTTFGDGSTDSDEIIFFIDEAGTGACL
jgi:hypothetical protein